MHVDADRDEFFVPMNEVFLGEILQLSHSEHSSMSLHPEQIQVNATVISVYDVPPYHATIEPVRENDADVGFIAYGNQP